MKNMKKIICLALAVMLLALCMSGCGSKETTDTKTENTGNTEAAGTTIKDLQEKGKLVIATSPDFPPFEELQSDGSIVGIEIDVLNLICEKLGVELVIEQMDFDSVVPGIQAGKFDMGVSGISVTPAREKNVLFTKPYCLAAQAIVVTADSDITCKADLEGKKVSVQTGTTAEQFCMAEGYEVLSYAANSDAELAVVNGKVDAWVIDDLTAADMVKVYNADNPGELVILAEAMTTEPYAFALPFGYEAVVAELNKIIDELISSGMVAETFEKFDAPYTAP